MYLSIYIYKYVYTHIHIYIGAYICAWPSLLAVMRRCAGPGPWDWSMPGEDTVYVSIIISTSRSTCISLFPEVGVQEGGTSPGKSLVLWFHFRIPPSSLCLGAVLAVRCRGRRGISQKHGCPCSNLHPWGFVFKAWTPCFEMMFSGCARVCSLKAVLPLPALPNASYFIQNRRESSMKGQFGG